MNRDITGLRYQPGQPVSVVLCCHNKAAGLPQVITALARGIVRPDLVVLSDDQSKDGSIELFLKLCEQYRLPSKVVAHSDTQVSFRLNTLRNDGVAACPDGLVLILDADLVLARTGLQRHQELHCEYNSPIISTGPRLEYARAMGLDLSTSCGASKVSGTFPRRPPGRFRNCRAGRSLQDRCASPSRRLKMWAGSTRDTMATTALMMSTSHTEPSLQATVSWGTGRRTPFIFLTLRHLVETTAPTDRNSFRSMVLTSFIPRQ
jgi:hypothetical protein